MFGAALKSIVLAAVMLSSRLAAQSAPPEQLPPAASEIPPPLPQGSSELPPFPHYPQIAPREHYPNWRKAAHAHRRTQARRRAAHHHARAHHARRSPRDATRQYFPKRTIRQCHAMNYRQIMQHRYCRAMMKQDLQARSHRAHRHALAHRHRAARHHRTRHHRR
jgi:hypothetical protein